MLGSAMVWLPLYAMTAMLAQIDPSGLVGDGAANYREVVSYDLAVRLDPEAKRIAGHGKVRWRNTTAVATSELWWHLYLNAFRNDRSTLMRESTGGKLRKDVFERGRWGAIEVKKLAAEGTDLLAARTFEHPDDDNEDDRTVIRTPLPRAIAPGESIVVDMEFEARLPKVFARSGYAGGFFMVGQWFPKIGVLEDGGWNCHQYHATSEFFADYGKFRVAITVPEGFIVGATGPRIETKKEADGATTFIHEQDRVHDFAWTADPRFVARERTFNAGEVSAQDRAEVARLLGVSNEALALRDVAVTLLLQPEHVRYEERYFAAVSAALEWYGLWYGVYPYDVLTLVDGPRTANGAMGMEYPTLITGGVRWPSPDAFSSPESVTVHELGHQYWYGLVGNNEFEEAWLDEGFNTYSEGKVLDRAYGSFAYGPSVLGLPLVPWFEDVRLDRTTLHELVVLAGPTLDRLVRPAWKYRSVLSYGINSYFRPALVLSQLERDLGPETMARAMRVFQLRYRYRHPTTAEFIATVEEVAGRSLRRFFDRTFYSEGAIDYSIAELTSVRVRSAAGILDDGTVITDEDVREADRRADDEGRAKRYDTTVVVERVGELDHPVNLLVKFADGSTAAASWDGEYRWEKFRFSRSAEAVSARLHPEDELLLDLSQTNDSKTISTDLRPGIAWAAHVLYVAQTLLQWIGGIL